MFFELKIKGFSLCLEPFFAFNKYLMLSQFHCSIGIAKGTLIFKEFATIMCAHFSREGEIYEYS